MRIPSLLSALLISYLFANVLTACARQPLQPVNNQLIAVSEPMPDSADIPAAVEASVHQLAYIGNDGNVYVALIGNDGTKVDSRQITSDATTYMEGEGRSYHRLAWSQDGRLAFAAMNRSTSKVEGDLYVVNVRQEQGERADSLTVNEPALIWSGERSYVIYLYWSPNTCPTGSFCNQLAFLDATEETMGLQLIQFDNQNGGRGPAHPVQPPLRLGSGRPFYFGWSRDGSKILWHVNGSALHSPDSAIVNYTRAEQRVTRLGFQAGSFLAPAWSPKSAQWLAVTLPGQDDNTSDQGRSFTGELTLFSKESGADQPSTRVLADVPINAQYVWSPNGQHIAYAQRHQAESGRFGPIHLYSLEGKEATVLTPASRNILGFFWSPDGSRIGYIHDLGSPDPRWSQWRTVALENRQDRGFTAFRAGFGMRFKLGSFSQYAQSHQYWSPDGRYLLIVDEDSSLVSRIWLIDTEGLSTAEPLLIGEGSLAVWAWGQ